MHRFNIVLSLSVLASSARANNFHYPPARLDCRTASGLSITFFGYATDTEANKRYNGNVYVGPVGEQSAYAYDQIHYLVHSDSSLDFVAAPNTADLPSFEMHLDRPGNSYAGGIDLLYKSGTKVHYRFQSCTESNFTTCR